MDERVSTGAAWSRRRGRREEGDLERRGREGRVGAAWSRRRDGRERGSGEGRTRERGQGRGDIFTGPLLAVFFPRAVHCALAV